MTKESLQSLPLEDLAALAHDEGYEEVGTADRASLTEFILENLKDRAREKEAENSPPVRVEESKYLTTEARSSADSSTDLYPIPDRYNQTRIVFMVRDSHWAFAYWDLEDRRRESLAAESQQLVLRVHEMDTIDFSLSTLRSSFDIPIRPVDSSWYIYLPNQDCCYILELGFITSEKFTSVARSNSLRTPRESVADSQGSATDMLSEFDSLYMGGSSETIPQRILAAGKD